MSKAIAKTVGGAFVMVVGAVLVLIPEPATTAGGAAIIGTGAMMMGSSLPDYFEE